MGNESYGIGFSVYEMCYAEMVRNVAAMAVDDDTVERCVDPVSLIRGLSG